ATNHRGQQQELVKGDESVLGTTGTVYRSNGSPGSGTVQSLQGTVPQVDRSNGLFTLDIGNYNVLTVSLPHNTSQAHQNRFQSLRAGDQLRLYGMFLNNSRVELRRFYYPTLTTEGGPTGVMAVLP